MALTVCVCVDVHIDGEHAWTHSHNGGQAAQRQGLGAHACRAVGDEAVWVAGEQELAAQQARTVHHRHLIAVRQRTNVPATHAPTHAAAALTQARIIAAMHKLSLCVCVCDRFCIFDTPY